MFDPYALSVPLQNRFRDEIAPGERVQWAGQPQPSGKMPRFAWSLFTAGLFFLVIMTCWMVGAVGMVGKRFGMPNLFVVLLGLPGMIVAVGMVSAPSWIRRRLRRAASDTLYVVTDQRAVIFNAGYHGDDGFAAFVGVIGLFFQPGIVIQSFRSHEFLRIERIERDDGTGDVTFGSSDLFVRVNHRPQPIRIGFFSIRDAREVERLLLGLQSPRRANE